MNTKIDYKDAELEDLVVRTGYDADWEDYADNLRARQDFGLGLPENVTQTDLDNAAQVQDAAWRFRYCENDNSGLLDHFLRESAGNYISDLLGYLAKSDSMSIMSGHDSSLAPLVAIFVDSRAYDCTQPPVGSFLAFEVYNSTIKLRLRWDRSGDGEYVLQKACGSIECTMSDFVAYAKLYEDHDRSALCAEPFPELN